jgi:hypothetical protein
VAARGVVDDLAGGGLAAVVGGEGRGDGFGRDAVEENPLEPIDGEGTAELGWPEVVRVTVRPVDPDPPQAAVRPRTPVATSAVRAERGDRRRLIRTR